MNPGRGNRISAQEQHREGQDPQSCASNWDLLGITGNWHCLSAIPTALKMSLGSEDTAASWKSLDQHFRSSFSLFVF